LGFGFFGLCIFVLIARSNQRERRRENMKTLAGFFEEDLLDMGNCICEILSKRLQDTKPLESWAQNLREAMKRRSKHRPRRICSPYQESVKKIAEEWEQLARRERHEG